MKGVNYLSLEADRSYESWRTFPFDDTKVVIFLEICKLLSNYFQLFTKIFCLFFRKRLTIRLITIDVES